MGPKKAYERVIAIQEDSLGHDHPSLAMSLNNLALVLREEGRLETGPSPVRTGAPDHPNRLRSRTMPNLAVSLNNLASLLHQQGEYDAARSAVCAFGVDHAKGAGRRPPECRHQSQPVCPAAERRRRVLPPRKSSMNAPFAIEKRALGPGQRQVAVSLNNLTTTMSGLADLLHRTRRYDALLPLYAETFACARSGAGRRAPQSGRPPRDARRRVCRAGKNGRTPSPTTGGALHLRGGGPTIPA